MGQDKIMRWAVPIIILIGVAVFFNGIFNDFIVDDNGQITENLYVHSLRNIPAFFTGGTFYNGTAGQLAGIYYRPISSTVFSTLYSVFGSTPLPFHVFQIILYILNACMVFLLFSHFFKKSVALALSLVFLVHPINSESALYISNTQEVLFFFFGITSLWVLIKVQSYKFLYIYAIGILFSLFSKEAGILFILIAISYAVLFDKKRLNPILEISIIILAIYAFLRIHAIGILPNTPDAPISRVSFFGRLLMIPSMFLFYIKTFFFPHNLASSYHWVNTQLTVINLYTPLVIDSIFMCILVYFAVILHKKYPHKYLLMYSFFGIWFIIGILFHLQIFPLDMTVAERWFYFPIVGLLGMGGVLLDASGLRIRNKWSIGILAVLFILLSIKTFTRTYDWRSTFTLASHDIQVSANDYGLENELGFALIKLGRYQDAKSYIEASIVHYPFVGNYINLGTVNINLGDYSGAKDAYTNALSFGDYYLTYEGLGGLTLVIGDTQENIQFLNSSLHKFPQDAKLWLYLAILEYRQKNVERAKEAVQNAYNISQDDETSFVYNKIMNNLPLNLNIKAGR